MFIGLGLAIVALLGVVATLVERLPEPLEPFERTFREIYGIR
jgi:hypothetical protein